MTTDLGGQPLDYHLPILSNSAGHLQVEAAHKCRGISAIFSHLEWQIGKDRMRKLGMDLGCEPGDGRGRG
jgi:hypothetical protein